MNSRYYKKLMKVKVLQYKEGFLYYYFICIIDVNGQYFYFIIILVMYFMIGVFKIL